MLEQTLAGCIRPAVALTDEVIDGVDSSYLAARHPHWTIFVRSPDTRGVARDPIMERLFPYGLTTDVPPDRPVDSWERAARIVHESYRRHRDPDVPPRPADRGWDDGLAPFLKESNVRLVTTTLASVESLGRSWGPISPGSGADGEAVTPEELSALAELEHASWRRHLQDNGWRPGARDDRRRLHPALVPWSELPDRDRRRSVANVSDAIATLASLGYRSSRSSAAHDVPLDVPHHDGWHRFCRSGTVTARRSTEPRTWRTRGGDVLQAAAGDWWVSDGIEAWSVAEAIFPRTYTRVAGDTYRRTGHVEARRAEPGEVIGSLEGETHASDGDWVLRGEAGEEWVVTAEHFAKHYSGLG